MSEKYTLSVLVENKPGVLTRISALSTRRGFNIHSLAVGPTEHKDISRITVIADAEGLAMEQITKQLNKLVNVLEVVELGPDTSVERELYLIKVHADNVNRTAVPQVVDLFCAHVVDVAPTSVVIETIGSESRVKALLTALQPYGVKEIVQLGTVAVTRGPRSITDQLKEKRETIMTAEEFCDDDADLSVIQSRKVVVIGYGSRGHTHALNLRNSSVEVAVGLHEGSASVAKAEEAGLPVKPIAEVVAWADAVTILAPDRVQVTLYREEIEPNIKAGSALLSSHGLNIHFGYIEPSADIDVVMVAPKGPGHTVRHEFESGRGVPMLVCVEQDVSDIARDLVLSYVKAIGGTRVGAIKTTLRGETETNLFGEQSVLCGGVSKLIQYGFETLVEAGYQPEMVYFEVCHEMKLIVDLINEGGIFKQRWSCSDTAEYGDYVSGPRVIIPKVKEHIKEVLSDIQNGTFAKRFTDDQAAGVPESKKLRAKGEAHPIEATGREVRSMFVWRADVDKDYIKGSVAR